MQRGFQCLAQGCFNMWPSWATAASFLLEGESEQNALIRDQTASNQRFMITSSLVESLTPCVIVLLHLLMKNWRCVHHQHIVQQGQHVGVLKLAYPDLWSWDVTFRQTNASTACWDAPRGCWKPVLHRSSKMSQAIDDSLPQLHFRLLSDADVVICSHVWRSFLLSVLVWSRFRIWLMRAFVWKLCSPHKWSHTPATVLLSPQPHIKELMLSYSLNE